MRHRMRGRKLGRSNSHRKAMFRNMAASLICSVRVDENDDKRPHVPGRIVTTLAKAKELRPFVERLVTMARKSRQHERRAAEFATAAERNSEEWRNWRQSEQWNHWNQSIAPAVTFRRRAFSMLRSKQAVDVLFDELAGQFHDRPGGYTRVVRLADVRVGDSGTKAIIEFVGERDRVKSKKRAPLVTDEPADDFQDSQALATEERDSDQLDETTAETADDSGSQAASPDSTAEEPDSEDGERS